MKAAVVKNVSVLSDQLLMEASIHIALLMAQKTSRHPVLPTEDTHSSSRENRDARKKSIAAIA